MDINKEKVGHLLKIGEKIPEKNEVGRFELATGRMGTGGQRNKEKGS